MTIEKNEYIMKLVQHKNSNKQIYLDYAAATPVDSRVLKAMSVFFNDKYGNPSAIYEQGLIAKTAVEESRKSVAKILGTVPGTVCFTSGGTESNNLAIFGALDGLTPGHIITTPIEHPSVLEPIIKLKKQGLKGKYWNVSYLNVGSNGLVNADDVIKLIRPNTKLISIMYANNEMGSVQPIAEIGKLLVRYRKANKTVYPYFHTDACQAAGFLDLNVERLHVDLLTINGGKIYGPKGSGLLYVRRGVKIDPQILGGKQEHNLRAGTENVPGIAGLSLALKLAQESRVAVSFKLENLSKYFLAKLGESIPSVRLNGPAIGENRLPNNINLLIPEIESEKLLIYLDAAGIACSVGSACAAEDGGASHVLEGIGLSKREAEHSIRFSLGKFTTKQELDFTVKTIKNILNLIK